MAERNRLAQLGLAGSMVLAMGLSMAPAARGAGTGDTTGAGCDLGRLQVSLNRCRWLPESESRGTVEVMLRIGLPMPREGEADPDLDLDVVLYEEALPGKPVGEGHEMQMARVRSGQTYASFRWTGLSADHGRLSMGVRVSNPKCGRGESFRFDLAEPGALAPPARKQPGSSTEPSRPPEHPGTRPGSPEMPPPSPPEPGDPPANADLADRESGFLGL